MIIKTVQKGFDKIEHVEYGDKVKYFYSAKNRNGRSKTEEISKRITARIIKDHTDEEYHTLLETVSESFKGNVGQENNGVRSSLLSELNN